MRPSKIVTLADLLQDLFTPEELILWVGSLAGGEELLAQLPVRNAIPAVLADEVARGLHRRGLVGDDLRESLLNRVPGRKFDILRIFKAINSTDSGSDRGSRPGVLQLEKLRANLDRAYIEREQLSLLGESTEKIDDEIVNLRRQVRTGPVLVPGDTLQHGRFCLYEVIGQGGFATVWKAYDRADRRLVAVKVLHGDLSRDRSRVERFERGARQMARLRHPHVVPIIETAREEEGFHYFVMEYVPGSNLYEAVLSHALSVDQSIEIVLQVGRALSYAHRRRIVHRDITPTNILVDANRSGFLTDFDLVGAADTTGGTRTGMAMGSFLFAAPEVLTDAKQVDHKADVYSLGMVLLFCLARRDLPPTVLRSPEKFLEGVPCSPEIRRLVLSALDWNEAHRISSAAALCASIEQANKGQYGLGSLGVGFVALRTSVPMKFVHLSGGEFLMGTSAALGARDEVPGHKVRVSPFLIAETPVTQAQWSALADNPSRFSGPERPVERVPWYWAVQYANLLSKKEGLQPAYRVEYAGKGRNASVERVELLRSADGFRLPTEAEWEYACRAGSTTRYFFGDDPRELGQFAWYHGNSEGETHPVHLKSCNPWGLYDLYGNVTEWCEDSYIHNIYTSRASGLATDPVGVRDTVSKVVRGGSWNAAPQHCTSSRRTFRGDRERSGGIGFRLVLPISALLHKKT